MSQAVSPSSPSLNPHSPSAQRIVVIGAGIGGLTAAALLARQGHSVLVVEQAAVAGGCASTFQRRGFTFDVGATQVAGLEPGGIHHRIFQRLDVELPAATDCDPACAVYLPGEETPIQVWRDPQRWKAERERQFPGSDRFWQLMQHLFEVSWAFQGRDPIIPPRSFKDIWQTLQAVRPQTLITVPYLRSTVGDVLRAYGLAGDRRLKQFLDLQLKLYSQVDAEETAVLYAATALSVSQAPQGLSHVHGSMQVLSDRLMESLLRDGGQVVFRHRAEGIHVTQGRVAGVQLQHLKSQEIWTEPADHVIANVTVQNLVQLLGKHVPEGYQRRVENLPKGSGAFVLYLGVKRAALPQNCPPHLQFLYDEALEIGENNSLFVSVSQPGDGRAPEGYATVIASSFTDPQRWDDYTDYDGLKQHYTETAIARLSQNFDLRPAHIVHCEAATPRTFARFTHRQQGIVGGVSQRLSSFGPFGFATRTPLPHLWLVGDSTHPGEGTAGVSYAALTVAQQILKNTKSVATRAL
jgi:C-3',4' desaturase CrtD